MKKIANVVVGTICAGMAWVANAAWVSEQDARNTAEAFAKSDAVGCIVLSGCDVVAISQRGNIWVVTLSPSGHILLSRTDLADPIVGFSKNDFLEPDPDSPAYAYLAGIDFSLAALESYGGTRHDRWDRLLAGGTGKKLRAAAVENPDTIVIPPFLESHYNQCQPYNDYAPVYEASTNGLSSYRGRCPCGCVATAAAQGFRHFRWPARIDRVDSFSHDFTDTNKITTSFPIRFDGHLPVDWAALDDNYVSYTNVCVTNYYSGGYSWRWKTNYDLLGTVPDTTRHPIARLIMFADVLAHMSFKSNGSGANYSTVANNVSEWYVKGHWVDMVDGAEQIKADILCGVPCQISIGAYDENNVRYKGHDVVAHGWAESGSIQYLYINFGWGGSNDGYYNLADDIQDYQEKKVYVGHYPRAKPQIDPLPKVCGTSLALNWHFPDLYTNNLSGFAVSVSRTATTPSTFREDFSAPSGSSSSSGIYIGTDNDYGYDGNLLYTTASTAGTYTFSNSYLLTSASVLTFRLLSFSALGAVYEIQASFNGGDWETIFTPSLKSGWGSSGWTMERVYLGDRGGESIRFRVRNSHRGSYYSAGRILIDDFAVTDVLAPVEPEILNVGKAERSLVLNGLAAGATYSFSVTPDVSGALVDGEASESVSTSIAGTRNTPIPGEQTYTPSTLAFSASDASGTWSYSGTAVDDTTILDKSKCSVSVAISGTLTASSSLSFGWSANNYYGNGSDALTVVFTAVDGTEVTVWETSNAANRDRQNVNVSLGELAGLSGRIRISCNHSGSYYIGDQYGGRLYAPQIANVLVPSVPAVAWNSETLTALGTPQILAVTLAAEGFYRECGLGATTFDVTCSENVTSLAAWPSHLALVGDDDVSVTPRGKGRFTVTVTPSGISEDNVRSRMILTLAAADANGTAAYKDISLRFAPIDAVVGAATVSATTSSGSAFSVEIPYEWLETSGIVPSGSSASAYEAALAATADADGDGIPNWAEYVCGTSPTNSSSKLTATIRIENGVPIVGYEPSDRIANGFKAVIKGTNNLLEDFSNWQVTTGTTSLRFFRVEIIPE